MRIARLILFLIFVLFTSAALAAKPEKTLVCHVGNELGSSGETYQDNPDCTIPVEWVGDPADYICPDAGKVDLILVSKKAKHINNPSHSFEDDTGYLWEDYAPEEGIGDDPADFEEGDLVGIDRGCEMEEERFYSLNDTGIISAGEHPSGVNATCTSATISAQQDCHTGRDFTHNDDSDGYAGFSFTKLDTTGTPLIDQSVSYDTQPWACVQDNVTGLVWEVKTTTPGIHFKNNIYQWGGLTAIGRDHPNREGVYYDPSWNELVQGSNDENLCGFNDWRVPTHSELSSIITKGRNHSIEFNFFPNTLYGFYWSSSPFAFFEDLAWVVLFPYDSNSDNYRSTSNRVRLVRFGQ